MYCVIQIKFSRVTQLCGRVKRFQGLRRQLGCHAVNTKNRRKRTTPRDTRVL
jgi:hypothetical protein